MPVSDLTTPVRRRPGRRPTPVVVHPEPLWEVEIDAPGFAEALDMQMSRHGDTAYRLHKAVDFAGGLTDRTTLVAWRRGRKAPQTPASLKVLAIIEDRYRLPAGYFLGRLNQPRAMSRARLVGVPEAEARRLAWHLPDDFNDRCAAEREEILQWVRSTMLGGSTAYRRFQAEAAKQRYGLRFTPDAVPNLKAPAMLREEVADLIKFKSATLTALGFERSGVWGEETAAQREEHLSLMFGALAASPSGEVKGAGVGLENLTLALLVCPAVWDWYIRWREQRRGFFTGWEMDMLLLGAALARAKVGWLRQNPGLAGRLQIIPGLVEPDEIATIQADWDGACDRVRRHLLARAKEIQRVKRVHRDPFEPLLPVLEAASPLGEYRKIADEILKRMPDERRHPLAAAEAVRAWLMVRFGLHLGLRQKNLRQLLLRRRDESHTPERDLERIRRGELRWSRKDAGWEVFIPCAAFKNARSAYFSKRPFRLLLPDLGGLYEILDAYVDRHRRLLLKGARDPETVFVKTVKRTTKDAAYDENTFYEAWRLTIQRYGVYNPYTKRGAIAGLLPHGPHSVRDVLATHVLKTTGSYEQASYAIQDTPETVAAHYGRFLPQDKAELAAKVLNRVWDG